MKTKSPSYIIIPGFGEKGSEKKYRELGKKLKDLHGGKIKFYNPTWDRKTIRHWIDDFEVGFKGADFSNVTLIGFSMGSLISLILSEKYKFKKVIFASLSPYFKENIKDIPTEASNFFGKNRMKAFSLFSIPENIKSRSVFLFGDQDWQIAISQAKKLSASYKGKFILIKDTPHDLTSEYIKKITTEA